MSWARGTLRRGTSGGSVWQVDANYPQARIVVGSAPTAGWVVTGPGIAQYHVELYWDGNGLYVCDPQGVGDVRLDGRPVHAWVQVQGRGQLVFGQAILELETSVAEATALVSDPGAAPRISLVREQTRVKIDDDVTEIPPSKAVISRRPPPPPGRTPTPPPPPPRTTAPAPRPPPGPTAAAERPRLGGATAGGQPLPLTLTGEQGLRPISGEATRMFEDGALLETGPALEAPAAIGISEGFGASSQGFGASSQGFGGPAQGFGPTSEGGASGVQVDRSLQPLGPPSAPTGGLTGGFVQPPAFDASAAAMRKENDGSVPRRTRLLLALFLAVVVAWLMMPTPEEEAAEQANLPQTLPALSALVDAGIAGGVARYVNPSTFVPVLTAEPQDGGLARTPESVAAGLVADGRIEDALVQYEALRALHPEQPAYHVMSELLRRQLETRCVNGQRWDGSACAP
ncbi:MAG: FHA domain-containing protein [Deltaproteobacteria bacterium]